ncbi:MAG: peptide-methionine (S)-S-oxide reductase MsrA [Verrucomicrobiota bacterium]
MKTLLLTALSLFALGTLASCEPKSQSGTPPKNVQIKADMTDKQGIPDGYKLLTLGGGCYWCVEAVFQQLEGVHSVISGFMGGHVKNPTYEEVVGKKSGHIEVIQVVFNPEKLSLGDALAWFWASHDPTTKDRQGNDVGPQYASAIFYHDDADKEVVEASLKNAQDEFKDPIVTQVRPADTFYLAPDYHQDYYFQNQNQGYCRYVIKPKLEKLKLKR